MKEIIKLNFNNTDYSIEVTGNVDKIEGFIYYTFKFDEENSILITKYDGEKWRMVNMKDNDFFAQKLGEILDKQP
ncbi:hypothetical protein GCM10023210_32160 [Chryseobacterium ginsengisoli]|uniref:Uncharacterized protein n=1 Tax=Chryseobacterium ginsengisoli TaxID=363853 RepID=A0ABP9MJ91_9FLAO